MQASLDAPGFFDKVAASMANQPEPLFFAFYYQAVRRSLQHCKLGSRGC